MGRSVTDVANRALQLLGAASIMNLTDNTVEARECTRAYDACRLAELRVHRWNFAKKRAALAPDVAEPAWGYLYQYTMPVDCLRVLLPNDACLDWQIEGRKILTNQATSPFGAGVVNAPVTASPALYLLYVADITDPTQWDPLFAELVSARMAAAMCEKLTQSNQKKQDAQQQYRAVEQDAKMANAFENTPVDAPMDDWLLARTR